MAHNVFISYSNKDKTIADAICAKLEENNVRCWIAPRDVLPGMDYGDAIISAINGSEIVILAFSGNTNKSEHVKNEVERAASGGKTIIPFRVENVVPSGSLALHLSRRHWMDALTPPLEKHLKKLIETVRYLLSKEEREVGELPVEEGVKVPKKKSSFRDFLQPQWIIAGIVVVALFIIAIVYLLQQKKKDTFSVSGAIDQTKQEQLTKPPVWSH